MDDSGKKSEKKKKKQRVLNVKHLNLLETQVVSFSCAEISNGRTWIVVKKLILFNMEKQHTSQYNTTKEGLIIQRHPIINQQVPKHKYLVRF